MKTISLATALFLLAVLFAARAQHKPKIEGPFPARDGETCVVCNGKLSKEDSAFLIDGQRVGVMKEMEEEFLQNPLQYVSKLRPESSTVHTRQSNLQPAGYLWLGIFVLAGLVFGGACAHMAVMKGQSPWQWFLLGFCFSAPATVALALKPNAGGKAPEGMDKVAATHSPVVCPGCGNTNHPAASACSRCGAKLTPMVPSEAGGSGAA